MIKLSNGHVLKYVVASGALAFDGKGWWWERIFVWLGRINPTLFTVITKTLTREPRKGNYRWWNPFRVIAIRRNYIVNAVGLKNKGIEWFCKKIGPKVNRSKIALVDSIYSESISELVEMAKMLNPFPLVGVELNLSCPNRERMPDAEFIIEACREVKKVSCHPIFAKLSVVQEYKQFIRELERIGIEVIDINSVPWKIIFPKKKSPLARFGGGGVSGKAVQKFTWTYGWHLANHTKKITIIFPSVWGKNDLKRLRENYGAKAFSFGSVFMLYPWRPTSFVKKELERTFK